jgi:hypothetical protein
MTNHIEDDTVPKEVPLFARTMFVKQTTAAAAAVPAAVNESVATPAASNEAKGKKSGKEPSKKKQKCETSDKSLKMGLFHMEKGASIAAALPKKGKLKDNTCMDFCSHDRKCNFPHMLCKNGKHYYTRKNLPDNDKVVLLNHMDEKKKMWLNAKTFS